MSNKKDWTGERLETYVYADVAVEHLHRYALASQFVAGKVVADIASGEGYGSSILSKVAASVTGIDIDVKSVKAAQQKYKSGNLVFKEGSAQKMPLETASIDVLVSFETIEHHDQHEEMFAEIRRVLKPDGLLIMSSPDKKYYTDVPQKINPFHIKELYLEEFAALASKYFPHTGMYLQRCINGNSIIAPEAEFGKVKVFSGDFDGIGSKPFWPLFNMVLASDQAVPKMELSVFDGEIVSAKILRQRVEYVRNSTTFKVGSIVLAPFMALKRLFK